MLVAAKTCKQAVGYELYILSHKIVVHADQVGWDCVTNKLMLYRHCLCYNLKYALTTCPVVELAAQSGGKWLQVCMDLFYFKSMQVIGLLKTTFE